MELHEKYVPVLSFARGERFFPMPVEDFLGYSALCLRGQAAPLAETGQVTARGLAGAFERPIDVYLRSVPQTLADRDVVARWSRDTLEALSLAAVQLQQPQLELARLVYRWFGPKTEAATRLFWWNGFVFPQAGRGRRSRSDLPRLDLPPEVAQAAADAYVRSQALSPNYTYYYRMTRDADYLCLQYWFFYAFNDWATGYGGMNDHEGDWEGVYLFFGLDPLGAPKEPPAYVTYVGHHSRITKPWGHPDVTRDGTHPVAYVAGGSHASYPEAKAYDIMEMYGLVDYATGDGITLRPADWKQRTNLDSQPWARSFLGTWGTRYWLGASRVQKLLGSVRRRLEEYGLPGVSGPRGPRFTDEGTERPNWARVADWAGLFEI